MSFPATRPTPVDVARACLSAHRAQDWDALRTLFHPNARIGTFAGGGRPESPEQAIARLQGAHDDFIYHANITGIVEIDDRMVLLDGRVQYRTEKYGMADVERCWLYVVCDGLLYRSAVYGSRHLALSEYETYGPTLGIPD